MHFERESNIIEQLPIAPNWVQNMHDYARPQIDEIDSFGSCWLTGPNFIPNPQSRAERIQNGELRQVDVDAHEMNAQLNSK